MKAECEVTEDQLWDLLDATHSEASAELQEHTQSCPECRERLAKIEPLRAGLLDLGREAAPAPPSPETLAAANRTGARAEVPNMIGPYKILDVLGQGGMGRVYLAEQERPFKRRVALKVIRPGMDSREVVARFEAERQALAMMSHPAIARVYDAGTTSEGRPYFALEHVPGLPLNAYCDKMRLGLPERLGLFLKVCHGAQHAHQKGVIHRDLKPGNILVRERDGLAEPKIIDFGVAKALQSRLTERTLYTEQGRIIGTPEYMSPEQAEMTAMDVDTRTDIYSLGVILYELLSGTLPFDPKELRKAGYYELQRKIREDEPLRPSTRVSGPGKETRELASFRSTNSWSLRKALSGDLDWIVMMCLEKDPAQRYQSASELAADLQRHLDDEPVEAGPPSAAYRFKKFLKKHRSLVAVVAAAVVAVVAIIVTLEVARGIAQERLHEVLRLSNLEAVRELEEEAERLWPRTPHMIEPMRAWLAKADALRARRDVHRADLRRAKEGELRSQVARGIVGAAATEPDWSRASQELRWRVATTQRLLQRIENLPDLRVGERLAFAEKLRDDQPRFRPAWDAAIADIASLPIYSGVELTPIAGLVPLRRDPASGLWEFWHVGSGARPELRPDGTQWNMLGDTGIVLVLLPGGPFVCRQGEKSQYAGELAPFFMSKYEMTQGQWAGFTGRNPADNYYYGDNFPVESVSWQDCALVLAQLGLEIPTEAEWEYACRAGASTVFATGDTVASLAGYINAIGDEDGFDGPAPVGSLLPNAFGLYNMNGNAIEWCRDSANLRSSKLRWSETEDDAVLPGDMFRVRSRESLDPRVSDQKVTRGGHFLEVPGWACCSFGTATTPTNALWYLGVRPAMRIASAAGGSPGSVQLTGHGR